MQVRGLSEFFGGLSGFVCSIRRQYGFASKDYSLYVVERLELCRQNVSGVLSHLEVSITRPRYNTMLNAEERHGVQSYVESLTDVLECLKSIGVEWEHYLEVLQSHTTSAVSYRAGNVVSHQRGQGVHGSR